MKARPTRRDFIKVTAAGAIGTAFLSQYGCKSVPPLGLQLYTIRDAMTADVEGSLKIVSETGYKFVELADYANRKFYNYEPAEFLKLVKDLGMQILSSHTQVEGAGVTLDNAKIMAEDHAKLGVKFCLQPWIVEEMRTSVASYQRMAENWNRIGAVMKEFGIQFGYHNHNFEFATVEGKVPYYDVMLAELDKDLVTMELDMFWTTKAGHNPVDLFKKYPGRFKLFHLKDAYTNEAPFYDVIKTDIAPVGEGVIDFKSIIAAGDIAGMEYMIVEQDESRNNTIMQDIKTSFANLTTKILG
ncbi:MAG TPA: sugar phosphate isomerase/epimerase [Bacteroidales bacterium]|nr:sugar phosphate isomerase/epimerase [Bacteroidales bacterium]